MKFEDLVENISEYGQECRDKIVLEEKNDSYGGFSEIWGSYLRDLIPPEDMSLEVSDKACDLFSQFISEKIDIIIKTHYLSQYGLTNYENSLFTSFAAELEESSNPIQTGKSIAYRIRIDKKLNKKSLLRLWSEGGVDLAIKRMRKLRENIPTLTDFKKTPSIQLDLCIVKKLSEVLQAIKEQPSGNGLN